MIRTPTAFIYNLEIPILGESQLKVEMSRLVDPPVQKCGKVNESLTRLAGRDKLRRNGALNLSQLHFYFLTSPSSYSSQFLSRTLVSLHNGEASLPEWNPKTLRRSKMGATRAEG